MKSFFKFLFRNRLYSLINFIGLAVSLAFVAIIFSYSVAQLRISTSVPEHKRTYCLMYDNSTMGCYGEHERLLALPEIELLSRVEPSDNSVVKYAGNVYLCESMNADENYFEMMGIRLIEGDASLLAEGGDAAIISGSFAKKLFGDESPIAKILECDDEQVRIVGIAEDVDASLATQVDLYRPAYTTPMMARYAFSMFLPIGEMMRVSPDTDPAELEAKIKELFSDQSKLAESLSLVRSDKLYFHDGNYLFNSGRLDSIKSLFAAAMVLLVLALLNYVNLNTALVGKRSNEMATRRLLGSSKKDILMKYMAESGVFTLICFVAALLLAVLLSPTVNKLICPPGELSGSDAVRVKDLFTVGNILVYLLICAIVSAVAGLLPALLASRVSPIDTIKGATRRQGKMYLSRVFIVLQNVISISLIALSLTMELQYKHMTERDLGVDNIDDVYYHRSSSVDFKLLKDRLQDLPCVESVGLCNGSVPCLLRSSQVFTSDDIPQGFTVSTVNCDSTAIRLLGYRVKERFSDDTEGGVWVSQHAFELAGKDWHTEEGRSFFETYIVKDNAPVTAVIDDYVIRGLSSRDDDIASIIRYINNWDSYNHPALIIKTRGDHEQARNAILECEARLSREFNGVSMEPSISDYISNLAKQGEDEARRNIRLLEFFMVISVLLSLSGLVAISIHFTDSNAKSIALHKVFGASTGEETARNLKVYITTTLIADVIATPIAVLLCLRYLDGFSYRMELSPWIFVLTIVVSLLITFIAVILQVRRAAAINPVMTLKQE